MQHSKPNDTGETSSSLSEPIEQSSHPTRRQYLYGIGLLGTTTPSIIPLTKRKQDNEDIETLNFLLEVELLHRAMYRLFLENADEGKIETSEYAQRFSQVQQDSLYESIEELFNHEDAHVWRLRNIIKDLGGEPVEECEYTFDFVTKNGVDDKQFYDTAAEVETVGTAGYAGALADLGAHESDARSIHSVESRHSTYTRFLNAEDRFPNVFDISLSKEEVRNRYEEYQDC
ncbi:ferritin-like domain-containing protein [Halorussus sp. MSC15.2]|uniref:ferritin-like domain-containing protein n=1 Tax=Halorussus sp. MSC15.2 TaxID=2283638 RepID=UPI0013D51294|nr:ferritin-like domain-containing protein [Halorussus sp. MSC15.2]NEU59214.1 ferritin-like domain-containing protein [Halorussus sp. MSC15.2]